MTVSKISPEYPRISLPKTLEKLFAAGKLINKSQHEAVFKEEDAARALGYKGLSGASIALLAALKKFGLLEADSESGGLKISLITKRIGEHWEKDVSESFEALEQAAFSAEVFLEMREAFGNEFPPIAAAIEFLLDNRFMPKAVPRVLMSYYETLKYLGRYSKQYSAPIFLDQAEIENKLAQLHFTQSSLADKNGGGQPNIYPAQHQNEKRFYFQIPDLFEATVIIKGQVTAEVIDSLIGFLEVSKKNFPKD